MMPRMYVCIYVCMYTAKASTDAGSVSNRFSAQGLTTYLRLHYSTYRPFIPAHSPFALGRLEKRALWGWLLASLCSVLGKC